MGNGLYGVQSIDGRKSEDRTLVEFHGEDNPYFIFGVFDGHTGPFAAEFARTNFGKVYSKLLCDNLDISKEELLDRSFKITHLLINKFRPEGDGSGTTAAVAMVDSNNVYIASAGDSQVFLSQNMKDIDYSSELHAWNNPAERERVFQEVGKEKTLKEEILVDYGEAGWRTSPPATLMVSRSWGDTQHSKYIIPDPCTRSIESPKGMLLLASDGIFEQNTKQKDRATPKGLFQNIKSLSQKDTGDVQQVTENLVGGIKNWLVSGQTGNIDDITAIVVNIDKCRAFLEQQKKSKAEAASSSVDLEPSSKAEGEGGEPETSQSFVQHDPSDWAAWLS